MKIYIKHIENQFSEDMFYSAYDGFKNKLCKDVILFSDIMEVPANKSNLVVSYIEDTIPYFNRCGIDIPNPLNIPDELKKYCDRNIRVMTYGEFKEDTTFPIFVKSYDSLKLFPSGVINYQSSKNPVNFNNCSDDVRVLVSDYLDIISEYRVFVNRGKVIGMKHYNGNFMIFPDPKIINSALNDYKSGHISYTIDFGVTSDGRTVFIEANDAWSIGSYGLDSSLYAKFLIDRWIQLFNYEV